MNYFYTSLVFLLGFILPVQVCVNAQLARFVNSSILAALVSFAVGTIFLIVSVVFLKVPLPALAQINKMPIWAFLGGLIGASAVLGSIIAGPKIGALALVGTLLIGQLVASVLIDHFGWLGFPIQKVNIVRLVGVLLLVSGFFLIRRT
jgi:bacterial/archaeal transporter family-2 protein